MLLCEDLLIKGLHIIINNFVRWFAG